MARRKRDEPARPAAAPHEDDSPPPKHTPAFPIVGIGASAGGLDAFKEMLAALPKDAGMAYVLVVHLPPRHESMLSEILGRVSPLPLEQISDGMALEPDHVYVLPAGSDVDLVDGVVMLTPRQAEAGHHRPVDHFFHSLAETHGHKAIGVILSGTASDGTLGIQEIKAAGGITFAQDDSAQQTSMPRSAIQTGAIDFVLRPQEIAEELGHIANHPIVAQPAEAETVPDLAPVIDVLRESVGVDFTHYKHNTLYRRIVRRILLHKLAGLDDYVKLLQSTPLEADALYQDILINVTSFFRNPEAFDALKNDVFPALTHNRSRHDPVRIWTLGCSTGEEAYSLAMAFAEFAESLGRSIPVQVFATDLNHASIEKARAGVYARGALADLTPERVRRFFVELDGAYRITKPIRDACIFARHNVLEDPPFSRIDLVSCRNMLIYLGQELQQKVIPILHYALRPNGFLWLGTSETIGSYRDLFDLRNTKYKIYAKKPSPTQLPQLSPPQTGARPASMVGMPAYLPPAEPRQPDGQRDVDRILVGRYAPPGVVIRGDLEILQYRGNTAPYLTPAPGRATLNLLKMLREGLVLGVRSAITRAKTEEVPVRVERLTIGTNGGERKVNIEVIPVKSGVQRAELFVVLFEDVPPDPERPTGSPEAVTDDAATQELGQLKQELAATREYLQSVIEQQEAANEELQSANEEVQSANEELQSINEELETSKEEVQSSNEELATVNDELHGRNVELAQVNNDLVNLLSSVQMAIVMLGPNLRIRRFTPMAERLLNLIPTDVGRPMADINTNFDVPDLDVMITEAIDSVSVREREVQDRHGRWFLLRVRPYRTLENKIDGAVIVLVDVDTLKRSEEMFRQQTELLNLVHEPVVMWELDGYISYWNKAAEETYGFTALEATGRKIHELLLASPPYDAYRDALARQGHHTAELVHTRRDGQKIIVESHMVVVTDTDKHKRVVQADRPITAHKESERVLRSIADDLVSADRNKDEFLAMLAHELRNPLAPMKNVVAVLRSGAAESRERALDIIDRQVSNMSRLVDDLLDVSRMTLSNIELRKESVDIVATVRRIGDEQGALAANRQQTIHIDLPAKPLYVEGDAVRLEQIVANLLSNALKYTHAGGEVWLSVERARGAEEAIVRVRDNGIGIAADKLPHVFDMFMRATRAIDARYGGLGVGLTLVRKLTELHGGRVEASSRGEGHGAEFVVRLPLLRKGEKATPRVRDKPAAPIRPRRVLVVDDNADNVEATALSLRLASHEVAVADNGERALELVVSFEPEVALIDIGMPGMDGYALAKALRQKVKDGLRLVAVSGYGHAEARTRAKEAGFDDYLVKPASIDDINRILERLSPGA